MYNSVFEKEIEISFSQCYTNGRIKISELSNILQLMAGDHATLLGLGFYEMARNKQAWVLSRIRIEIDQLPKWKEKIVLRTWIKHMEAGRSIRIFEVLAQDKMIVSAHTDRAVINTEKRSAEKLDIDVQHIRFYPDRQGTRSPASKLDLLQETSSIATKQVFLSDLDMLNHVNNGKYLDWCLDRIPAEKILDNQITALDMNFIRELRYHDIADIHQSNTGNSYFMTINKNNRICFAIKIECK